MTTKQMYQYLLDRKIDFVVKLDSLARVIYTPVYYGRQCGRLEPELRELFFSQPHCVTSMSQAYHLCLQFIEENPIVELNKYSER